MRISMDAPVFSKTDQIADLLVAGFLWVLCSIPIITIGPASVALYYAVVKSVRRRRDTVTRAFFSSFKSNIKQGIAAWLICILYSCLIAVYVLIARQAVRADENIYLFVSGGLVLAVPLLFVMVYLFPVISRFQAGLIRQFQYSIHMSVRHAPVTVLLLMLFALMCLAVYFFPIVLVILPGVYALVASMFIERIMKKYMAKEIDRYGDSEELPWYLE